MKNKEVWVSETALKIHDALVENEMLSPSVVEDIDLDSAYDIQFELLRQRILSGEGHTGWKVGLTSKAMQAQQQVHEPCLGHLMTAGHVGSPGSLDYASLKSPGFENELCLLVGKPLSGDVSVDEAHSAIHAVAPALEIIEKRCDFTAGLPAALAANAQQCAFVTGEFIACTPELALENVTAEVFVNDVSQETASGEEVLGSPVNSLVWLAKKLSQFGYALRPGDYVMSGSFTKQYVINSGDQIRTEFNGIGAVNFEATQ